MQKLIDKILKFGEVYPDRVLKVDSFLNHQVDMDLMSEIAEELYSRYLGTDINKILTLEVSGIPVACACAQVFNVPIVYAKKTETKNLPDDVYTNTVFKPNDKGYDITVAKKFLSPEDRILIVDDFLAKGYALKSLIELSKAAGATVVGAGIVIEKGFEHGGDELRKDGVRVESMVIMDEIKDDGKISFRN